VNNHPAASDLTDDERARLQGVRDRYEPARRRQALWQELLGIFRHERPDDAALARVSTLAEVALDQVFAVRGLSDDEQATVCGMVRDYAECGTLYGYVLGMADARRQLSSAGD